MEGGFFAGLAAWGLIIYALIVPLAGSGPLRQFALKNNGDLREELGWEEMVSQVAGIRDSLPAEQRASVGVFTSNYGEQGAVEDTAHGGRDGPLIVRLQPGDSGRDRGRAGLDAAVISIDGAGSRRRLAHRVAEKDAVIIIAACPGAARQSR